MTDTDSPLDPFDMTDEEFAQWLLSDEVDADKFELDSADDGDDPDTNAIPEAEVTILDVDGSNIPTGGALVLSGPRAGSVVSSAEATDAKSAHRVATAGEALSPGEVLVLVHRPGFYAKRVPAALARVHADFSHTGLSVGASVSLPKLGEADAAAYLTSCGAAAVRIADPEGFALPGDFIEEPPLTPTQLLKVGYVATVPAVGTPSTKAWDQRVIRSQRAAGANVLLTPGRSLDHKNASSELTAAGVALDHLLEEVHENEIPAWNLSLRAEWLVDTSLRHQLLAELVDRDDVLVWHLRVRWPLIKKSFGQTLNSQLLAGYRELAETARREDRSLILPTTGLTGWVTLGWGSTGFGTGPSYPTQSWADSPKIASKKGVKRPTIHRHHVSALMHTITVDSHNNLSSSIPPAAYPACLCPYCRQQAGAPAWLPEIEAGHAIYAMGALAADIAATPRSARKARITTLVSAAHALNAGFPAAQKLNPKEAPDHLTVWSSILP